MNKGIYIGAVVLIIVGGIYFFINKPTPKIPPPKNSTIVAFGDSLVVGVGASEGHDFVSLVSKKIGETIINKGVSGDTTQDALSRIDDVLKEDPGLVIVLLGGNDYLKRIPKETTFANLHTIVSKLKEKDIRILLLGVRGGLLRDTYASDFGDFAEKEGIPYISNVLDGLIGNQKYMSDEVHPSDAGYEIIANRVAPVVKKLISK